MGGRVRRLPFVLLGLMTLATLGGPIAFGLVLNGGGRAAWPPDRPVEWWTLGGISALVLALMIACIGVGLANSTRRAASPGRPGHEAASGGQDRSEG
jgi:hypothetical protein